MYLELLIAIDYRDKFWKKIGKLYRNGKWNPKKTSRKSTKETILYLRRFMTAVSVKYEKQFSRTKNHFHIGGFMMGKKLTFLERKVSGRIDFRQTLENAFPYFANNTILGSFNHYDIVIILLLYFC